MPAYVIFIRESSVHSPAEMKEYLRKGSEKPMDPKMQPLAIYGAMETLEGKAADGVVVLQFPTVEDAKAWYHSDHYQAASVHRKNSADYRAMIVQGL